MVSVIIPTYNYAAFIAETLDSVIRQTYTDFECLIIDNGSTDNTKDIVEPYLSDPRFKYYYRENKGVAVARNEGMSLANGKYIQFLDADDLIEKNKLKAAVEFLEANGGTDIVYSDMRYFKNENPLALFKSYKCDPADDKPWMSYVSGHGKNLAEVFLKGNTIVISSPVFRRALLEEVGMFDESLQHNEDWDFWFRIALGGKQFKFFDSPEAKTLIRLHKTSASVNVFKMQVCGFLVLKKNSSSVKNYGLTTLLESRKKEHLEGIKRSLLQTNDHNLFQERLLYLKQKGLFPLFFRSQIKNIFLAKLALRFKKVTE